MMVKHTTAAIAMLVAWLALGITSSRDVHAQDAMPPITPAVFTTGGGVPDPHPPPLSPQEHQLVAQKIAARNALVAQFRSGSTSGSTGASPFYSSGNWYYANNYKLNREPSSGYPMCGTSATPNPPNGCAANDSHFYGNLCGPGSTTFIVHVANPSNVDNFTNSTWGNGWYGFLNRAAYYEMVWAYDSRIGTSVWGTYWSTEKSWINQNEGANSYISDPCDTGTNCNTTNGAPYHALSYSSFDGDLNYDLNYYGLAAMAAVDTAGLSNWNGSHYDHFVSVNGWDPTDHNIAYSDTGNDPGMTSGTFYPSESSFYNYALQGSMAEKMVLY